MPKFELSQMCLATENFQTVVETDHNGNYIIFQGLNKPVISLINDHLAHNARMLWLEDAENPKHFAIKMSVPNKKMWAIVRVMDGTRLCELEDVTLIEETHPPHSFNIHRKAVCLIDNKTFKCYKLSMENLLHLGKICKYLGEHELTREKQQKNIDYTEENKWQQKKIKILGLPAPSCFPSKFNEFLKAHSHPQQLYTNDDEPLMDR